MPNIQIMSEHLSNKIAAGEVVERPASVVKELVENAVDAGSSRIEVYVQEGGLERIKVVDNGNGMDREDSCLAFERHATSKLKSDNDLFRIATLGFRGEALPSIAAVSNVTLQTWNGIDEVGTQIKIKGGKVVEVVDAPLRKGTSIEVEDLFYNTPARYKYLKTIHTELSHISDFLNRMAMAHPNISFLFIHNDKELLATNGNRQLKNVISSIYGYSTAKQMLPFQATHIDFEVEGYIGKPELTRSTKQYISLVINGRYIKNYAMHQAIVGAYHTLLPLHRYPVAVLSLKMDPTLLDINVHPSKLDVRLSKEHELTRWLEQELKSKLINEQLIPQPLQTMKKKKSMESIQQSLHLQLPSNFPEDKVEVRKANPWEDAKEHPSNEQADYQEDYKEKKDSGSQEIKETIHSGVPAKNEDREFQQERQGSPERIPLLYPLAQLHGTYLLAQNEQGLYMIDQHAAQERIWFEHYYLKLNQPLEENQELLIPIVLEFTSGEYSIIKENMNQLERVGLFLEEFGHHSYIVRSHPSWFPSGEEEELIRDMIQYMLEKRGKLEWIPLREKVAAMMSCKQSIKANQYLTRAEMESLLEQLRETTNPFTCPHGRPITVLLSKYDIEKMFKRVM
jgi:DNA mismatch repair protein MutL